MTDEARLIFHFTQSENTKVLT